MGETGAPYGFISVGTREKAGVVDGEGEGQLVIRARARAGRGVVRARDGRGILNGA